MSSRELLQAEILARLNQLSEGDLGKILSRVQEKAACGDNVNICKTCDLSEAAEICRLLLSMDRWERKGYLRWMKAKHPESDLNG